MNLTSPSALKITAAGLVLAGCVLLGSLMEPGHSVLVVGAAIGLAVYAVTALRYPEVFLVCSVFMPQWKTAWPLSRMDHLIDLTLLMLGGLVIGLGWRFLKHVSGLDRRSLSGLFQGQWTLISSYFAFCALVALSYLYTTAPQYGGTKLLRFLLIGTLFLISGVFLIREEKDFRRFSFLFIACACMTAIQIVLNLEERTANTEGDITRIGTGWLMGMGVLLLLSYSFFRNSTRSSLFIALGLPILSAGLVGSAARGPIVSLALILPLTYFGFSRRHLVASHVLIACLLVASCLGSYIYLRHAAPEKYSSKISEMFLLSRGDAASGSGAKRLGFYRSTLAAIPEHFWLGQGIGSWSVFYYGRDSRGYPHNLFLETTFEEGFVGQLSLLVFLGLLALATYRMLKAGDLRYGVLAGLLLYCVSVSMFSGDLDDNRLLWLWAGVTMAICRNTYLQRRFHSALNCRAVPIGTPLRSFELRPSAITE